MKYEAVEVEALGQGVVTEIVRAALDALLPEPLRRLEAAGELACETCETCEFLLYPCSYRAPPWLARPLSSTVSG